MPKYMSKYANDIQSIMKHGNSTFLAAEPFNINNYVVYATSSEKKVPYDYTLFAAYLSSFDQKDHDYDYIFDEDKIELIKKPASINERNLFRAPYVNYRKIKDEVKEIHEDNGIKWFYYGFFPTKCENDNLIEKKYNENPNAFEKIGTFPVEIINKDENKKRMKYKYFLPVYEYEGKKYIIA